LGAIGGRARTPLEWAQVTGKKKIPEFDQKSPIFYQYRRMGAIGGRACTPLEWAQVTGKKERALYSVKRALCFRINHMTWVLSGDVRVPHYSGLESQVKRTLF